ncbi:MAG: type II toxin-antitoxin system Phd/YefM family antitoxin [Chloracidobacterium sp.]|nr:type II toxin-antitoxin system Phd/YefM family antitoxin [Chloracidobacterium sp.]
MTTIELHPEFLSAGGRKQFAVIPYDEFVRLEEWIEDMIDLHELRVAREENKDQPTYSLDEVKQELGID